MTERRALLTDREREIIAGDADVRDAYKYQTISRVRRRFGRLGDDLDALEAHGGLASELREVVCGESADPTDDPESALRRLSNELGEPITVGDTVYESGDSHPLDPTDTPENAVERGPEAVEHPESATDVDVGALDLPGRGEDLRRRQAAVRAVLAHLREHGEARTGDLRAAAWDADGETYADARSLWKNAMLPALGEVDAAESAGPSGKWRWVGEERDE